MIPPLALSLALIFGGIVSAQGLDGQHQGDQASGLSSDLKTEIDAAVANGGMLKGAEFDKLLDEIEEQEVAKHPTLVDPVTGRNLIRKYVRAFHEVFHNQNHDQDVSPVALQKFSGLIDRGANIGEEKRALESLAEAGASGSQLLQVEMKIQRDIAATNANIQSMIENKSKVQGLSEVGRAAREAIRVVLPPHDPPGSGRTPGGNPSFGDVTSPATPIINAGSDRLASGDAAGALKAAGQAMSIDPSNLKGYYLAAMANYDMKNYAGAADAARQAVAISPGDSGAAAMLKLTDGRDAGSGSAASSAADAAANAADGAASPLGGAPASPAPSGASSAVQEARVNLQLGDYAAAVLAASRAIQERPSDPTPYYLSAVARMKGGDAQGALKDAVAGLAVDPKNKALLDAKAEALNRLGRYRDALAASSAALELDPKDPYAYYNQGLAYFGLKDRAAAMTAFRNAAALNPQFQAVVDRAAQAPADADLAFLLPDMNPGYKSGSPAPPGAKAGRLSLVTLSALLGGLLIALGLLQLVLEPVRSAFTRLKGGPARGARAGVGLAPGRVPDDPNLLRGQYRVGRQIGMGGMGMVYEGEDVSLERRVAIKRMREELKRDARERQRFLSEAKLVGGLHHPNIVDIYAIVEQGDEVYLVFEYIEGKTVHDLIGLKKRFTLPEAATVIRGAGAALDFAHSRAVIHRDLKPSNIMASQDGRTIKVMDFGIARAAKDAVSRYSMTNTIVGTPPYMAPEQEQGAVRRESDVFALGVCLYEMLAGRLPWPGSPAGMLMAKLNRTFPALSGLAPGLPAGIDDVMARALDPDADRRLRSAGQLVAALDGLLRPSARSA